MVHLRSAYFIEHLGDPLVIFLLRALSNLSEGRAEEL